MAIGVAVANAILLVTFAERERMAGAAADAAAIEGARSRLRPILMTSCAMIAGMLPLALGFGRGRGPNRAARSRGHRGPGGGDGGHPVGAAGGVCVRAAARQQAVPLTPPRRSAERPLCVTRRARLTFILLIDQSS